MLYEAFLSSGGGERGPIAVQWDVPLEIGADFVHEDQQYTVVSIQPGHGDSAAVIFADLRRPDA